MSNSLDKAPALTSARKKLRVTVLQSGIRNESTMKTSLWGQFLDDRPDAPQVGIYGTAAALTIAAVSSGASNAMSDAEVAKSLSMLPGRMQPSPIVTGFETGELELTLKLAAVARATYAVEKSYAGTDLPGMLLSSFLPKMGAPFFHRAIRVATDPAEIAAILPTALIILAMFKDPVLCGDSRTIQAAIWLANEATDDEIPKRDMAFALRALLQVRGFVKSAGVDLDPQIGQLKRKLVAYVRDRTSYDGHDRPPYSVPARGTEAARIHYVSFPTDVVIAHALVEAGLPRHTRRYVLAVAESVRESIASHGSLFSKATGRVTTTEAESAHDFLTSMIDFLEKTEGTKLSRLLRFVRSLLGRIVVSIVLLVAILGFTALVILATSTVPRVFGTVGTAICTTFFIKYIGSLAKSFREI